MGEYAYHVPGMRTCVRHARGRRGGFLSVTSKVTRNVRKRRLRGPNAELRFWARVAGGGYR